MTARATKGLWTTCQPRTCRKDSHSCAAPSFVAAPVAARAHEIWLFRQRVASRQTLHTARAATRARRHARALPRARSEVTLTSPAVLLRGTEPPSQRRSQREFTRFFACATKGLLDRRRISHAQRKDLRPFASGALLARTPTLARRRAAITAPIAARVHKIWLCRHKVSSRRTLQTRTLGQAIVFAGATNGPAITFHRGTSRKDSHSCAATSFVKAPIAARVQQIQEEEQTTTALRRRTET